MSGPARVVKGTHDVRARGLPQFPVTLDLKTGLNFAAFCQASLPAGIFTRCRLMSSRHALRSIASSVGKLRNNPVLERDVVSMPAKICVH
jgi:hypothetical protein